MASDKSIGQCKVGKKGRATIPKAIREKLGVEEGDFVDFVLTRTGSIKITKSESS